MKNTKKALRLGALLLVIALALGFAGCGSTGKNASSVPAASSAYYYDAADTTAAMSEAAYEMEAPSEAKVAGGLSNRDTGGTPTAEEMSEKIIYNADATLETTDFDTAIERLSQMVRDLGGFMESTSVSGSNYSSLARGNAGARSAHFTIRIPSEHFSELTGTLSDLGNVPYCRTYSRNVTMEYYDVQSRLDAYRTQEARLLEMLAIAETVEDMLAIQQQLTEVQYQIDSLTGTLRYYDHQVSYSTVELEVQEVREYTPEPTIQLTYWERLSKEFRETLKDTGNFFKELFLWFVTSLPWLIPLALVIWLAVVLIRRSVRRNPDKAAARARRREEKKQRKAEKKARRKGLPVPPANGPEETSSGENDPS